MSRQGHILFSSPCTFAVLTALGLVGMSGCSERKNAPLDGGQTASDAAVQDTSLPAAWSAERIGGTAPADGDRAGRLQSAFFASVMNPGSLAPGLAKDDFYFIYRQQLTDDDIDLSARIIPTGACPTSDGPDPAARVGLMIRGAGSPAGAQSHVFAGLDGHGSVTLQYRASLAAEAKAIGPLAVPGHVPGSSMYVRLIRQHGKVTIALSLDRWDWHTVQVEEALNLSAPIKAGFVVAPSGSSCFAIFDEPRLAPSVIALPWIAAELAWDVVGRAKLDEADGKLTLTGGGKGIRGDVAKLDDIDDRLDDSLACVVQPITLPAQVVARVRVDPSWPMNARAGVMIRTILNSVASHLSVFVDRDHAVTRLIRPDNGQEPHDKLMVNVDPDQAMDGVWLRIMRTSDTVLSSVTNRDAFVIRASWSLDGVQWTDLPNDFADTARTNVFGGVFVTGADSLSATFDNIDMRPLVR